MEAIAIIPARGGSKGLPRKNVRLFCGKPLIAWSIETALAAGSVARVVVTSDDPEILSLSERYGAETVRRPPALSGDTSPSEAAILHAVDAIGIESGPMAFIQCTAPLMLAEDIDAVLGALKDADTAFTAAPNHRFLWKSTPQGALPIGHSKGHRPMRQELSTQYVEVGAVYAMSVEGFRRFQCRFYGRTAICPIDHERALEIDDETDFVLAEALMRRRLRAGKRARLPTPVRALVTDFDGVMTDNRALVLESGVEAVRCHRGDGWAVARFREAGVAVAVLTHEDNEAVARRCEKLRIDRIVAKGDKLPYLGTWLHNRGIAPHEAIYVGNDDPDVDCMRYVGCAAAPSDAYPQALQAAHIVLDAPGGMGCIRELWELVSTDISGGTR